ncbi:hypothetical protein BOKEGFJH_00560 [Chlamydia avium]|uniref:IncA family protein n=1 Tax=Chlamydia avium TaxID=1457141 RepID=A0ABN0MSZ5_9CHLA|nr:hypothetical protein [Chlamydia avium]EPP36969.1 hypothetical protein CP10743SC13_0910 [Chlamydia psittaci 10_743_SC13]EPP38642.1 hypothetical protein CP10881SC42_0005 [Chlamydia avium]VVT43031.1 hypothetical protein BOKEGFJH_00560 [Chlamydia avium]
MEITAVCKENTNLVQNTDSSVDAFSRCHSMSSTVIAMLSSCVLLGLEITSLVLIALMSPINFILISLSYVVIAITLILSFIVFYKIFKRHQEIDDIKKTRDSLLNELSQYDLQLKEYQFQLSITQAALDNNEMELIDSSLMFTTKEEEFAEVSRESRQREIEFLRSQKQITVLQRRLDKTESTLLKLQTYVQQLEEENRSLKEASI